MSNKHTDQTGFSMVVALLAIIILCVVGIVAWTVIQRSHSKQVTQTPSSAATASAYQMKGAALGIDTPTTNDDNAIKEIGRTPAIIDDFVDWKNNGSYNVFPSDFVAGVISRNSTPMLTWQPNQVITGDKTTSVLTSIINGQQDSYIKSWADAAKNENHTIYIRLMHEMNGAWYPWGIGINGNTPGMYVTAFQHVVTIFHQQQANNVQFVWCVATSAANSSSNKVSANISSFFPGDNFVSWVAMDGYSRKPDAPKSFNAIFGPTYSTLTTISKRPVMVPETATVENPADPSAKANWITTSFLQTIPNQFPRIKAVLYFDSKGNGFTYQIDTSPTTLDAIRQVFASSYYQAPAPTTTLSY